VLVLSGEVATAAAEHLMRGRPFGHRKRKHGRIIERRIEWFADRLDLGLRDILRKGQMDRTRRGADHGCERVPRHVGEVLRAVDADGKPDQS
jgi:hypothetical protein